MNSSPSSLKGTQLDKVHMTNLKSLEPCRAKQLLSHPLFRDLARLLQTWFRMALTCGDCEGRPGSPAACCQTPAPYAPAMRPWTNSDISPTEQGCWENCIRLSTEMTQHRRAHRCSLLLLVICMFAIQRPHHDLRDLALPPSGCVPYRPAATWSLFHSWAMWHMGACLSQAFSAGLPCCFT